MIHTSIQHQHSLTLTTVMGNNIRRRKEQHNPNACINVLSPTIDTLWLAMCHPLDNNDEDTHGGCSSDSDESVLIAASMFGDAMDLAITTSMSEVSYIFCLMYMVYNMCT